MSQSESDQDLPLGPGTPYEYDDEFPEEQSERKRRHKSKHRHRHSERKKLARTQSESQSNQDLLLGPDQYDDEFSEEQPERKSKHKSKHRHRHSDREKLSRTKFEAESNQDLPLVPETPYEYDNEIPEEQPEPKSKHRHRHSGPKKLTRTITESESNQDLPLGPGTPYTYDNEFPVEEPQPEPETKRRHKSKHEFPEEQPEAESERRTKSKHHHHHHRSSGLKQLTRTKKQQEVVTETQFHIVKGKKKPEVVLSQTSIKEETSPEPSSTSLTQKTQRIGLRTSETLAIKKPPDRIEDKGAQDTVKSEVEAPRAVPAEPKRGKTNKDDFLEEPEEEAPETVPPSQDEREPGEEEDVLSDLGIQRSGQIYPNYADRHRWKPMEYFLCSVLTVLDISNWLKFPALYMEYGGLYFLVPYLTSTFLCCLPFLLFETIIGQFSREGMLNSWKLCPLFKGLGWFLIIQNLINVLYVQQIVSWACQYVIEGGKALAGIASTTPPDLANCNDYWNPGTLACEEVQDALLTPKTGSEYFRGVILSVWTVTTNNRGLPTETRTTNEFNLTNYGSPVGHLIIALGFGYFATFIGLFYKQKLTVKLGVLTLIFAMLSIGLLAVRGLSSPGARKGLIYTIDVSDYKKLFWLSTWREGFSYSLYSPSIGLGLHMTLGSFKEFKTPIKRHCINIITFEVCGSIIIGLIITMYAGIHAWSSGRTELEELEIVPEMIFEIVPQALAHSRFVWMYLFVIYLGIGLIGIYFTIINILIVSSSIMDTCRKTFQKRKYKRSKRLRIFRIGIGLMLLILFVLTIPIGSFNASIYINRILDDTRLCFPVLFGLFIFSLIGGYITGPQYLSDCHYAMTGRSCGIYWRFCWKVTMPAIIILTALLSIPPLFEESEYRGRKINIGLNFGFMILRAAPLVFIPILMVKALGSVNRRHKKFRWALVLSPKHEHRKIISSGGSKRTSLVHYLSFGGKRRTEPFNKAEERSTEDEEDIPMEQVPDGFILKQSDSKSKVQ